MAYSVELRFDPALARRVVGIWKTLADHGVSAHMPASGAVPHLSLAVYDDEAAVDPGVLALLLERLAAARPSLPVTFPSLGIFPTAENVLFLAAVVAPDLLALHRRWHDLAAGFRPACRPYYLPGRWVPHCTLAMLMPTPGLLRALDHVAAGWTPLAGRLASVALIRALPVATLLERELADAP
jgi:2'-5' RNA ligase